ncbi:MAG: hypothetical protein OXC09_02530 [Truepera sp.]|nr:hypothetical protein [Truepera sp.]
MKSFGEERDGRFVTLAGVVMHRLVLQRQLAKAVIAFTSPWTKDHVRRAGTPLAKRADRRDRCELNAVGAVRKVATERLLSSRTGLAHVIRCLWISNAVSNSLGENGNCSWFRIWSQLGPWRGPQSTSSLAPHRLN